MKILKFSLTLFLSGILTSAFCQNVYVSDKILGNWLSESRDLKVEIFKKNDKYFGKVVWFVFDPKTPNMEDFKDTESMNEVGLWTLNDLINKTNFVPH